jgi:hypothetical protein
MLVEEARAYRYEASICGLDVYGSQWTSMDVLGWLPGPEAGAEVLAQVRQ